MIWNYYEIEDDDPPIDPTGRCAFFFAVNENGDKITYSGMHGHLANMIYEALGYDIYFDIGAAFVVDRQKYDLYYGDKCDLYRGDKSTIDKATLSVTLVVSFKKLTETQIKSFLHAATDPELYKELFKLNKVTLFSEIRHIEVKDYNIRVLRREPTKPESFK